MRIDRKKLTLIVASLCGTGSSALALGQDLTNQPLSSVGRIGDGGVAAKTVATPAVPMNSRPVAFRPSVVADGSDGATGGGYDPSLTFSSYSPNESYGSGCSDGSCGNSCGSVCNTPSRSSVWLESETLLWWAKGTTGAPLVVGGTNTTGLPTIPLAGGNNNPIGNNLLVGMRIDAGKWLDCNQNFGVGARGYGILTNGTTQTYPNNGNSVGVPFFNTTINQNDTYLVNLSAGPNLGAFTGTVQVKNGLNLVAGELYGRALLAREGNSRVDLLGGYTFVRLDSELGLRTHFVDSMTNSLNNGSTFTTQDTFSTKNQFHGGHIGLMNEVNRGRFSFTALGKIALGNMEQTSTVSGSYSSVTGGNVFTPNPNHGLLAQRSNIGTLTRNQFTFLPEAGAKMKYQIGNAQFGVGYTLLMFPSVAMAGNQIDHNVDIGSFGGNTAAPNPKFTSDTFFLHGLDLGVTFKF